MNLSLFYENLEFFKHCLLVMMMQEIHSGGIMVLQQLKELNSKLPQLFTVSSN